MTLHEVWQMYANWHMREPIGVWILRITRIRLAISSCNQSNGITDTREKSFLNINAEIQITYISSDFGTEITTCDVSRVKML